MASGVRLCRSAAAARLIAAATQAFGENVWLLRAPAALAATALVPLAAAFARAAGRRPDIRDPRRCRSRPVARPHGPDDDHDDLQLRADLLDPHRVFRRARRRAGGFAISDLGRNRRRSRDGSQVWRRHLAAGARGRAAGDETAPVRHARLLARRDRGRADCGAQPRLAGDPWLAVSRSDRSSQQRQDDLHRHADRIRRRPDRRHQHCPCAALACGRGRALRFREAGAGAVSVDRVCRRGRHGLCGGRQGLLPVSRVSHDVRRRRRGVRGSEAGARRRMARRRSVDRIDFSAGRHADPRPARFRGVSGGDAFAPAARRGRRRRRAAHASLFRRAGLARTRASRGGGLSGVAGRREEARDDPRLELRRGRRDRLLRPRRPASACGVRTEPILAVGPRRPATAA